MTLQQYLENINQDHIRNYGIPMWASQDPSRPQFIEGLVRSWAQGNLPPDQAQQFIDRVSQVNQDHTNQYGIPLFASQDPSLSGFLGGLAPQTYSAPTPVDATPAAPQTINPPPPEQTYSTPTPTPVDVPAPEPAISPVASVQEPPQGLAALQTAEPLRDAAEWIADNYPSGTGVGNLAGLTPQQGYADYVQRWSERTGNPIPAQAQSMLNTGFTAQGALNTTGGVSQGGTMTQGGLGSYTAPQTNFWQAFVDSGMPDSTAFAASLGIPNLSTFIQNFEGGTPQDAVRAYAQQYPGLLPDYLLDSMGSGFINDPLAGTQIDLNTLSTRPTTSPGSLGAMQGALQGLNQIHVNQSQQAEDLWNAGLVGGATMLGGAVGGPAGAAIGNSTVGHATGVHDSWEDALEAGLLTYAGGTALQGLGTVGTDGATVDTGTTDPGFTVDPSTGDTVLTSTGGGQQPILLAEGGNTMTDVPLSTVPNQPLAPPQMPAAVTEADPTFGNQLAPSPAPAGANVWEAIPPTGGWPNLLDNPIVQGTAGAVAANQINQGLNSDSGTSPYPTTGDPNAGPTDTGTGTGTGTGVGNGIGNGIGNGLGNGLGNGVGNGIGSGIGTGVGTGIGDGLLTNLLGTGLGIYGADKMADAYERVAEREDARIREMMGFGAQYRSMLPGVVSPNYDITQIPGLQSAMDTQTQTLLRQLSTSGNPFGNPGGLAEVNKYIVGNVAMPAYQSHRDFISGAGGLTAYAGGAAQGPNLGPTMAGINAQGQGLNAIGQGLASLRPRNNITLSLT